MIRIHAEHFNNLDAGGKDAVLKALQQAIRLEHSTIPPYLYALYSLDSAKNGEIAAIIQSIVVEEMLHMTLVCNILNALGGNPVINDPGFLVNYPSSLPGAVEGGLIVNLAPFSLEVVENIFMVIEKPEESLDFPILPAIAGVAPTTIGQFYSAIEKQIIDLGDEAFVTPQRNQIGPDLMGEAVVVTNVASAVKAIDIIIEQGEGTSQSPLEVEGADYAHYYRFAEVLHGKRLVKNPDAAPDTPADQHFIYKGPDVKFDQSGVYAVPTNPKSATYPENGAARHACDTFNYTYTNLLKALQATFSGQPQQLDAAIGLMMALKLQAQDMMSGANPAGIRVGPSFEYQGLNPS